MITSFSYPGIAQGSGVTWESMGDPCWIPLQKAHIFSGEPRVSCKMRSVRGSSYFGETAYPSFSKRAEAKTEVLTAEAVTDGAK